MFSSLEECTLYNLQMATVLKGSSLFSKSDLKNREITYMYFRFPYLKFHIMEGRTSNNGRGFGCGWPKD